MVLTKAELIGSLQNEVRILLHLATKLDGTSMNYRPTPQQRSSLELLRYLSLMGPLIIQAARTGTFDPVAWTSAQQAADGRDLSQTLDVIAGQSDQFTTLVGDMTEDDFRGEIELFGRKATRGYFIVNTVLSGYAAYRTQLFLYLKICGRTELNTMNLWGGMDPTPAK